MDIQKLFSGNALNRLTQSPFIQPRNITSNGPIPDDAITTEDGDFITTEDGDVLITED